MIVLQKAPHKKAECKVNIGLAQTKEWTEEQNIEEFLENVTLSVPQPQPEAKKVRPSLIDQICENPEESQINPFNETGVDDEIQYTPIAALSTFSSDWQIKARISKKYERRTWQNARGSGYLLNIDLID